MAKNSMEVVSFIEGLAEAITKAKADSAIDWKDVRHLAPLIVLGRDAIADSSKIMDEIKGANGEELELFYTRLVTATMALLTAILP